MPARPVRQTLQEYARGLAGGLLFSLPLLYTMEVWWVGFSAGPVRLGVAVLATFGLLLGYNWFVGLRRDASFGDVIAEAFEEMALGLLAAAALLWLLGRLQGSFDEALGKIVVEAMTMAVGVSVGQVELGGDEEAADQGTKNADSGTSHFGEQVVLVLCGAFLFAANVAPTEEVVQIAAEATPVQLLLLALLSLVLIAFVLHGSQFRGARRSRPFRPEASPLEGVVVTYAITLGVSAFLLWFFGRYAGALWPMAVAQTVVLGVPTALGAAAGRLLLQPSRPDDGG